MVQVTCVICGKEFESIKTTKKYCSKECMNEARRINYAQQKQKEMESGIIKEKKEMPEKQCLLCGKIFRPKTPAANQRSCCYDCMPDGQQLHRSDFIAKIKESRGGACERCGYDTTTKALDFHHLDPNKKDFTISNGNFKLTEAIEESKKCVLICSNCHRELHADLWDINEILDKEEVES